MNLLQRARSEFRLIRLRDPGFVFVASPEDEGGRLLEFWPLGEVESPDPDHWVIEAFGSGPRVLDVAGDVASHYLRVYDGGMRGFYDSFARSFNSTQIARLHEQYDYAVANEGEERPYATWARIVGVPAYFRGLPFQQGWPASLYRPAQRELLARMMRYLRTGRLPH